MFSYAIVGKEGKILFLVLCIVLMVFSTHRVSAHVTGASWEIPAGQYKIDVGYDPVLFTAGEYTRFDFNLKDSVTGDYKSFSFVWVRITHDGDTVLATGIQQQSIGPTTLLYEFGKSGHYALETDFRTTAGDDIATTTIGFDVGAGADGTRLMIMYSALFVLGCALGVIGVLVPLRSRLR